jgi:pyruvate/2-oxoglutarate dehydrogenase complex dihydrolipoamide dehydrogenase (E3) component
LPDANQQSPAALERVPDLAKTRPITHVEALELDVIPEHLVVIGGLRLDRASQAMRRFGSKVSVIDRNGRLWPEVRVEASELTRTPVMGCGKRFQPRICSPKQAGTEATPKRSSAGFDA